MTYVCPPFLPISWLRSIYFRDLSTICGVPVAVDSYWSSKRRYAAATDWQILQQIGNTRVLFF